MIEKNINDTFIYIINCRSTNINVYKIRFQKKRIKTFLKVSEDKQIHFKRALQRAMGKGMVFVKALTKSRQIKL